MRCGILQVASDREAVSSMASLPPPCPRVPAGDPMLRRCPHHSVQASRATGPLSLCHPRASARRHSDVCFAIASSQGALSLGLQLAEGPRAKSLKDSRTKRSIARRPSSPPRGPANDLDAVLQPPSGLARRSRSMMPSSAAYMEPMLLGPYSAQGPSMR